MQPALIHIRRHIKYVCICHVIPRKRSLQPGSGVRWLLFTVFSPSFFKVASIQVGVGLFLFVPCGQVLLYVTNREGVGRLGRLLSFVRSFLSFRRGVFFLFFFSWPVFCVEGASWICSVQLDISPLRRLQSLPVFLSIRLPPPTSSRAAASRMSRAHRDE